MISLQSPMHFRRKRHKCARGIVRNGDEPLAGQQGETMRGVTFLGERKLELAEFPDPAPGPHDVIVEIKASGMCGSDLKFYRATGATSALGLGNEDGPVVAKHEPCGFVAAIGAAVEEPA